jgi:hypothetical protein
LRLFKSFKKRTYKFFPQFKKTVSISTIFLCQGCYNNMSSKSRSRSRTSSSSSSNAAAAAPPHLPPSTLNRIQSSATLVSSSSSISHTDSVSTPANVTEVLTLLHREIPNLRNEIRSLTDANLSISSSISRSFETSKKAHEKLAGVYISDKEMFHKQLERLVKSHALATTEIAKEKSAILAELENVSSSFKAEKSTLTNALTIAQGRIEGLLRDAAARDVLLATTTTASLGTLSSTSSSTSVYALQTALHDALVLNNKEISLLRSELSALERDSILLTERTDALRNSISSFSASSTAEASQLLESATRREFGLKDVIEKMTRHTNEAIIASNLARKSLEEDLAATLRSANSAKESINTLAASSYVEIENARSIQEKALSSARLLRSSMLEILAERDATVSTLTASLSEQVSYAKALGDSLAAREASHIREEKNREEEVLYLRETLINERASFAQVEARLRVQVASANEASLEALRDKEMNDAAVLSNMKEIAVKFAELEKTSASKETEFVTIITDLRNALSASEQSVHAQRNAFTERLRNSEMLLQKEKIIFQESEARARQDAEKIKLKYNELLLEREKERSEYTTSLLDLKQELEKKESFYKTVLSERDERLSTLEGLLNQTQARLVSITKINDRLGLGEISIERSSSLSSPTSTLPQVDNTTTTTSSSGTSMQSPISSSKPMTRLLSSTYVPTDVTQSYTSSSSPRQTGIASTSSSSPSAFPIPQSPTVSLLSSSSMQRQRGQNNNNLASSSSSSSDAHFLSLSHVFGACALSIAWDNERLLSHSTQNSLIESISSLQKALLDNESSSSISIAVRDQHEMELHELRTSVSELRHDNSKLLSTLEPERASLLQKHEEMESGLSKAFEAFSILSNSMSSALVSINQLQNSISKEKEILQEGNERDTQLFICDSASLRNEIDTLRSTISIKTSEFATDLEQVHKYRSDEISALSEHYMHETAIINESKNVLELTISSLQESSNQLQSEKVDKISVLETERASMLTEIETLRSSIDRTKSLEKERMLAEKTRANLYTTELSRLSNQNTSVESEATNKVSESRKAFMRNVEERLDILRNEAQRARSNLREFTIAQDGRVVASTALISSLTDTINGLVKSNAETYKLASVDTEASLLLLVHLEKDLIALTNRFSNVRRILEGEIDAARSALSGADKGGLIRIQSVLARAEPLLQRLSSASFSTTGGSASGGVSVEVSLLKVMVERLTSLYNERKELRNDGQDITSNSAASDISLLSKYNAAMSEIKIQTEREKERTSEVLILRETLNKYRVAAQTAAQAAIEAAAAAATAAISSSSSSSSDILQQSTSSSSSSQQQQHHIITQKGNGLTSPALMARIGSGGHGNGNGSVFSSIPFQQQQQQQPNNMETVLTTQTVSINLDETGDEDE